MGLLGLKPGESGAGGESAADPTRIVHLAKYGANLGKYTGVLLTVVQLLTGNSDGFKSAFINTPVLFCLLLAVVNTVACFSLGAALATACGCLFWFYSSSRRRWALSYFVLRSVLGAAVAANLSMMSADDREVKELFREKDFSSGLLEMAIAPAAGGGAAGVLAALLLSSLGTVYFNRSNRRTGDRPVPLESPRPGS